MAFLDDIVDDITGQITAVGLSISGTEVSGGGYAALAPSYAVSSGGSADLTSALEFNGTANAGPVDGFILKRTGGDWTTGSFAAGKSFNSDGRIDVTSLAITET